MIVLAQVSDTHIDLGERTTERVRRVAAYLDALPGRIDAILVTGDITDHGAAAEYEQARALLAGARSDGRSSRPVYYMPGNHDDRATLRRVLLDGDGADTSPINQLLRIGELTVLLCDSTVPCSSRGELADETVAWLAEALAAADGPVLLVLHHPPVELYSPLVDPIRLGEPGRLADLVAAHPGIVGIVCGHAHTSAATTFAGVPLVVGPSVSSILGPEWETGRFPVVDQTSPPAVAFHVLDDAHRLTTHFRTVSARFDENAYDQALYHAD